ncbi:MAG: T9SS type A sorting domain-containing protein, partial [Candidatus Kapabacteria bacterium]|nr:T9SS type A sorting domain-containing protein [Candidatus Kapabacteria bacterium]
LRDWFCVDPSTVNTLLNRDFGKLDLIEGASTTSVMDQLADTGSALFIAPNPATSFVSVGFSAPQGRVSIGLFDATGRQIATAGEIMHDGTASSIRLDVSALPSGNYYVRLQHISGATVRPLIVQR